MKRLSIVLFFALLGLGVWGWLRINQPEPPMALTEALRIDQGEIRGGVDPDNPDVEVFNGIPYASARRWSAPTAPPQWGAITRDARDFGPECLQPRGHMDQVVERIIDGNGLPWWKRTLAKRLIAAQPEPLQAEDCLFLNVRTANRHGIKKLPVMVWIHGGSHQTGAGSSAFYQANGLVEKGVVLVTFNYRLGPFGYMAHPALSEESGTSGNYGLLDQVAALRWVQSNISRFGGDPNNVTIFGESAGAQSVSELMSTPLADNLYDKAILQSGVSSYNALHLDHSALPNIQSSEEVGVEFLSTLANDTATADGLRAIPSGAIIDRVLVRQDLTKYFLPTVDGQILPLPIGEAIRDGGAKRVPLLAGYNADEGTIFYPDRKSPTALSDTISGSMAQREAMLEGVFGANSAKALQALYGMTSLESWDRGAEKMLGDDWFGVHTRFLAKANVAADQPTWLYHFSRTPPGKSQTLGAHHAAEIPFVFNSHSGFLPLSGDDDILTERITSYWTNFAKTGNPNGDGLPEWPAYTPDDDIWLELDHEIKRISRLRARKLDILESNLNHRIDAIKQSKTPLELIENTALLSTAAGLGGEERIANSD